jgi:serine/threonine protein kinase
MLTYKLPQKNDTPLAKGTILQEKYKIIEDTFDQGGFGRIYKARDINMENRFYAIKEFYLNGEFKTTDNSLYTTMEDWKNFAEKYLEMLRLRFMDEASNLYFVTFNLETEGSIPRIVSSVIHEKGRYYYVMDYIEGPTLRKYVEKYGPLDESTAIKLIKQVAYVMEKVHDRGVMHRDISPNNIVLPKCKEGKNGTPIPSLAVLVDFGNARSFSEGVVLKPSVSLNMDYNAINQYKRDKISVYLRRLKPLLSDPINEMRELEEATESGTSCFVAPENLENKVEMDTYSLAATLYYILTGEYPNYSMFSKRNEMETALLLRKHNVSEKTILTLREILNTENKKGATMEIFSRLLPDIYSFDFGFIKELNSEWLKSQN